MMLFVVFWNPCSLSPSPPFPPPSPLCSLSVGGAQAWASAGQLKLADRRKWLTPTTTRMEPTPPPRALMRHHRGLQVPACHTPLKAQHGSSHAKELNRPYPTQTHRSLCTLPSPIHPPYWKRPPPVHFSSTNQLYATCSLKEKEKLAMCCLCNFIPF